LHPKVVIKTRNVGGGRCIITALPLIHYPANYHTPNTLGVGKTTAALAFCRELFGEHFNKRVLEMNASDERGIQAIRDRVKRFSQLSVGEKD
jgi:hypothetical protein